MNPAILAKVRRETMRWLILHTLNYARPQGMYSEALLPIIQAVYKDATQHELRRELDYLEERDLVSIEKDPLDRWALNLKRYGIEVAEYTCPCDPGIARPTITQA